MVVQTGANFGLGSIGTGFFALNADDRGDLGPNGKNSLTTIEAAAQITRTNASWATSLGQGAVVTYGFRSSASSLPSDVSDFSRFNPAQIAATLNALSAWSDVANINFQRVSDADGYSNDAALLFSNYGTGEKASAAFAYMPGSRASTSNAGDVWVNVSLAYNAAPTVLGYGYQVLTHEIGHAIGLSHPSAYNAEEGVTITYSADAGYYEDSRQYTIMSYFSEVSTGGNFNAASGARQYSAAPLLDDIAAVQRLYGANNATRAGDTVYGFNSNADRPWYAATSATGDVIFAVWDGGGTDTLDFSGFADNQLIDLRQGAFSNVGGLTGNVAIALGAVIEHAVGGAGNDRIIGNSADNRLTGGAGADTIDGGLGNDTAVFAGARESYTITQAGQTVTVVGPDGSDTLTNIEFLQFSDIRIATTPSGGVSLRGDVNANILTGTQFADSLFGLGGADVLSGLVGDDLLDGGLGADTVQGGDGDDTLIGGEGDDRLDGGAGHDSVSYVASTAGVTVDLDIGRAYGGAGYDTLIDIEEAVGSAFADHLIGGARADLLRGGGGSDLLDGGAGNDRLYAGDPGQSGGAADIVKGAAVANASITTAVSLDAGFDLLARDGVANATTVPHATVLATTHGGVEYYAFTVTAGARGVFDIDGAPFDGTLRLFDARGVEIASNDDSAADGFNATDPALSYTFSTAGVYYLQVAEWKTNVGSTFTSGAPPANQGYTLHVSLPGHATVAATLAGSILNGDDGDDYLLGGAGVDYLNGGAGNDTIDGGGGDDILVLANRAFDYVISRTAAGWRIDGPDGSDVVSNVERVQFAGAAPIALDAAVGGRFDALTYIASSPDLIRAFGTDTTRATAHYQQYQELYPRAINSFDGLVYAASNPDLARAFGTDATAATLHYIQYGFFEGRPTATFDPLTYAASSPDLGLAFASDTEAATRHYLTFSPLNTHPVSGFKPLLYIASNPELARSLGNDAEAGLRHYLEIGLKAGLPTTSFDPLVYIASNADLTRVLGTNAEVATLHYLMWGADEGRPTNAFDPRLYAASNLDIAQILGSDLRAATAHYVQYGFYEGRPTSGFDSVAYLLTYEDLQGLTPSQALDHWLLVGADENRIGDTAFGRDQLSHTLTGSSTSGTLGVSGDRDWFELRATAGQAITLDVAAQGAGVGSLGNSTIAVFDSVGRLIAYDDNSGLELDARVSFVAPTTGLYYLTVNSETGLTGTYRVLTTSPPSSAAESVGLAMAGESDVADDYVVGLGASDPLLSEPVIYVFGDQPYW